MAERASGGSGAQDADAPAPARRAARADAPEGYAAAAAALDTSAASLQALAQQQADYRRKLALLQHHQDLWQLVHQQQQQRQQQPQGVASAIAQADGGTPTGLATREDRMQHLHQTFQQRVMDRQAASSAGSASLGTPQSGAQSVSMGSAAMSAAPALLSQPLAGAARLASPSTAPRAWPHQLSGGAASTAARLSPQELEQMRKEQLERIQQFQFQQALAVQQAAAKVEAQRRASEDLQATQLHGQQNPLAFHVADNRAATPTQLLMQQQEALRQKQVLQSFLQQKQQHDHLLLHQQKLQLLHQQQQRQLATAQANASSAPHLANSSQPRVPSAAASALTTAVAPSAAPKRRRKSKMESQMEALVRTLARINNCKTSAETVLALDKMTTWVQRCLDVNLLRFAARDFPLIEASQRIKLTASSAWTVELQAKCASISGKILQVISVLQSQPQRKEAVAGTPSEGSVETQEISAEAREHAYATLKAQILYKQQKPKPPKKLSAADNESSLGQKRTLVIDTSASEKKARSEATPGAIASVGSTHIMPAVASTYGFKYSSVSARAPPLSPREAQRLYELDLSMRASSSAGQDDGDERLYFPVKLISKVMRKALPESLSRAQEAPKTVATAPRPPPRGEHHETKDEDPASSEDGTTEAAPASRSGTNVPSSHVPRPFAGPPAIKLSDDAVALVQECATEFLLFLTSEARDHAALENPKKSSISGANVVDSLRSMGFSPYAKVLELYNAKIRRMQDSAAQKKLERKLEKKQLAKQAAADAKLALEKAQQMDKAVADVVGTMVSKVASVQGAQEAAGAVSSEVFATATAAQPAASSSS